MYVLERNGKGKSFTDFAQGYLNHNVLASVLFTVLKIKCYIFHSYCICSLCCVNLNILMKNSKVKLENLGDLLEKPAFTFLLFQIMPF